MEVVTNVDGQAFRTAMTPVWSEFAKQYGAENISASRTSSKVQAVFERGPRGNPRGPFYCVPTW